jgi:hypothetical protein
VIFELILNYFSIFKIQGAEILDYEEVQNQQTDNNINNQEELALEQVF